MRIPLLLVALLPAAALLLLTAPGCSSTSDCPAGDGATVIFHNATFHTPAGAVAQGALAVRCGRIEAVGPVAEIRRRWDDGQTRLVDLQGGHAFPGMIDSLGNLLQLGTALTQVDLLGCPSREEMIRQVKSRAARTPKGQWILGMGWDQNLWARPELPTHAELSAAVPNHPVWLLRVGTLSGLANRKAMELCGITAATKDPRGGRLGRDKAGRPTGIFTRSAIDLILDHIPTAGEEQVKARLLLAQEACFHAGLTGLFVPGLERDEIAVVKKLIDQGRWRLPVSLAVRTDGDPESFADMHPVSGYKGLLDVRCVTLFMDGALGSRGAALLEAYADDPMNRGVLSYCQEEVEAVARAAFHRGFQVSAHCVGDQAAHVVLNAFTKVLGGRNRPELRWRIEHSQVVTPADRKRYVQLGIVPSMQPTHCPSDMEWAMRRLGPARKGRAYNWRAFADLGLKICGGSDFPVESHDPLKGIYAAVTTKNEDGTPPRGYLPAVRLSRTEAVDLFTHNAAYGIFQEGRRGRIAPGLEAHLTVYDRDILTVPEHQILAARVTHTVIGGQVVFAGQVARRRR